MNTSIRGRGNAAAKDMTSRTLSFATAIILGIAVLGTVAAPLAFAQASSWNNDPSCWISASPSTVSYGSSATLTWDSEDADSGWITDIGDVSLSGSHTLSNITVSRTYIFTVSGNGKTATCQTSVHVSGSGSSSLSCSIYPSQNNVQSGQATTLHWSSTNAQSAHLSADGSVSPNGSYTVYPSNTTTYTLTVYGYSGQSNQCQTTVYVTGYSYNYPYYNYNNQNYNYPYSYNYYYNQQPSCTIKLSNYNYGSGYNQTAQLSWSSNNATHAYISPKIGSVAVNGVQTLFHPDTNTQYTLTVTGPGGSATCQTYGSGYGYNYYNYNYPYTYPTYSTTYPYLQLTQIPYTGLDLGLAGTVIYWFSLALFAFAGGYLLVYYQGGILQFAFAREVAQAARNQYRVVRSLISR